MPILPEILQQLEDDNLERSVRREFEEQLVSQLQAEASQLDSVTLVRILRQSLLIRHDTIAVLAQARLASDAAHFYENWYDENTNRDGWLESLSKFSQAISGQLEYERLRKRLEGFPYSDTIYAAVVMALNHRVIPDLYKELTALPDEEYVPGYLSRYSVTTTLNDLDEDAERVVTLARDELERAKVARDGRQEGIWLYRLEMVRRRLGLGSGYPAMIDALRDTDMRRGIRDVEDMKDFLGSHPDVDLKAVDSSGQNALDYVVSHSGSHPDSPDSSTIGLYSYLRDDLGIEPTAHTLGAVAGNGNVFFTRLILTSNVLPDSSPDGEWTPLFLAATEGAKHDLTKSWLHFTRRDGSVSEPQTNSEKRAVLAEVNGEKDDYDPLERYLEVITLLLAAGASARHQLRSSQTIIHHAAHANCVPILELLRPHLQLPADLDHADENRVTALHYAARGNAWEAVEWLLSNGANPNIVEQYGFTPLHEALLNYTVDLPEFTTTSENSRGERQTLKQGTLNFFTKIMETLMRYGANPDAETIKDYMDYPTGTTPRQIALGRASFPELREALGVESA